MFKLLLLTLFCSKTFTKQFHTKSLKQTLKPRTLNQQKYVDSLQTHDLVFCLGPAGTGKTLFACNEAMKQLQKGSIDRVVITRPIVAVEDEQLGFLPGNINKKMDPWTRPIFDIFSEYYSLTEITRMMKDNIIEISPLAYMRGRTFKNAFIIADEMQNSSPNQMLMLTTRIGEKTKMVVTGDLKQSDKSMFNGLSDFIEKFSTYEQRNKCSISLIHLTTDDVERSPIVKTILNVYSQPKPDAKSYYKNVLSDQTHLSKTSRNEIALSDDAAMIPKSQLR
jgi:phosphate starvation-inducible PhoH-like protein